MSMKYTRLVFSFCACLAFSQAFGKAEGDLSVIRQNFNRIYVQSEGEESPLKELLLQNQPGFSVSDRVVMELQQRVPYEAARMRHYLKALQADGSWSDINYQDTNRSGWDPRLHAERILEMVKHFSNPENEHYHSKKVEKAIHRALRYWFVQKPVCLNWYYNQIGIPRTLGTAFILFEPFLTDAEKQDAITVMKQARFGMTGQNKVWLAGNVMMRGVLENDLDLVKQARDTIVSEIVRGGKEGIKDDGCFHQHGPQPQFGNYGLAYVYTMSLLSGLFSDTSMAFTPSQLEVIAGLLEEGYQWVIWQGKMDIASLGRQLFASAPLHKALSLAFAATELGGGRDVRCNQVAARLLENCFSPHNVLIGHKHFWQSDYTLSRRAGWMASLKMASDRVMGVESMNGDNMKGYYMGDGALYIYKDATEYYDIFPLWDWRKLPGVTCYDDVRPVPLLKHSYYPRNLGRFVGGLSDGKNGISAMELDRDGLKAQKFWLFADEAVLCLGAGISSDSALHVTTAVEQCWSREEPLRISTADDTRIWHHGRGYVLWNNLDSCFARTVASSGSWHDVMKMYKNDTVSGRLFTLYLDHGVRPKESSYCYAVLPETTEADLRNFRTDNFRVMCNDSRLQAVWQVDRSVCWAAVREPFTLRVTPELEVDFHTPGLYRIGRGAGGRWEVYFSDPMQCQDEVQITVNGRQGTHAFPQGKDRGTTLRFEVN